MERGAETSGATRSAHARRGAAQRARVAGMGADGHAACVPLCERADDCGDATLGCTGLFAMTDQGATKFKGCLPKRGVVDYDMGLGAGPLLGVPESAVSASLFVAEKRMDIGYYAGVSSLEDTNGFLYDVRTAYYSNPIRYQPLSGASFLLVSNSPLVALRPGLQSPSLAARMAATLRMGIGLDEICEEFGVSHRTAQRMTDALEETFGNVEAADGEDRKRRWRLINPGLSQLQLRHETGVEALDIAARTAESEGRLRHAKALNDLRDGMLARVPARARVEHVAEAPRHLGKARRLRRPRAALDHLAGGQHVLRVHDAQAQVQPVERQHAGAARLVEAAQCTGHQQQRFALAMLLDVELGVTDRDPPAIGSVLHACSMRRQAPDRHAPRPPR